MTKKTATKKKTAKKKTSKKKTSKKKVHDNANKHGLNELKYREEFCDMLIEHMAKGLSYKSFAPVCDTHHRNMERWEKKFPEWRRAKLKAADACRKFWEQLGIDGVKGSVKNFNSAVWIFNMKNRFHWRNEVVVSQEQRVDAVRIELPESKQVETIDLVDSDVEDNHVT